MHGRGQWFTKKPYKVVQLKKGKLVLSVWNTCFRLCYRHLNLEMSAATIIFYANIIQKQCAAFGLGVWDTYSVAADTDTCLVVSTANVTDNSAATAV